MLLLEIIIAGEIPANHKILRRLLDEADGVVGQVERPLAQKIRAGIQVVPNLPPAKYEVVMLVYDVTTFEPLMENLTLLYSVNLIP